MFKNKTIWIVIAVAAVLLFWVKGVYNNMVTQDDIYKMASGNIEQATVDLVDKANENGGYEFDQDSEKGL